MIQEETDLETGVRSINDIIRYRYSIPTYQRGYRWTKTNVMQLLNDIYEGKDVESLNFSKEDISEINSYHTHQEALLARIATQHERTRIWSSKQEYTYCIQPLVVANKQIAEGNDFYTVIDGQQRLTTISIMLAALQCLIAKDNDHAHYAKIQLDYQSRAKSAQLINAFYEAKPLEILKQEYCGDIDFDYMIWAYETALEYFGKSGKKFAEIFEKNVITEYYKYLQFVLLNCVQFIWYDASVAVQGSNEQKVFANFNTGKLPLTNAELIKAIFMNPANFGEVISKENKIKDRQITISEKWDAIETALHDSDFWAFVPHPNQYDFSIVDRSSGKYDETRIDVIFDFLVRKNNIAQPYSSTDEYATFIAIDKWISDKIKGKENKREIMDDCWNEVQRIFSSLRELFEDKSNAGKLYNLIGAYIYASNLRKDDGIFYTSVRSNNMVYMTKTDKYLEVFDFLNALSQAPRNRRIIQLYRKLKEMIFDTSEIGEFIRHIRYSDNDNDKISACLLVYNILKLNQSNGVGSRFNFLQFAKKTWQREHIFATQNEGVLKNDLFRKAILENLLVGIEHFNDEDGIKNNSYIKYHNYRDRGDELKFPEKSTDESIEAYINKNSDVRFIKEAEEMLLRYHYIKKAEIFSNPEKLKGWCSMPERTRFVDSIINYRCENKFFFTEIAIESNVIKAIEECKNQTDIEKFKQEILGSLQKNLLMDFTTQINNIFKDYTNTQQISPYNFLFVSEQDQDSLQKRLKDNIVKAYKNKLRGLIWFTNEDKDAILSANNKESEYINRYYALKEKGHRQLIDTIDNDVNEEVDDDNISDTPKLTEDKCIKSLNIFHDADLSFVLNAIALNKKAMYEKVNQFFEQGGSYCIKLADDSMGNMALLSGSDNAGISNNSFSKKSEVIYTKSKIGSFIPLETLMVFTGAYSTGNVTVKEWLPESRLIYLKEIITTLKTLEGM